MARKMTRITPSEGIPPIHHDTEVTPAVPPVEKTEFPSDKVDISDEGRKLYEEMERTRRAQDEDLPADDSPSRL